MPKDFKVNTKKLLTNEELNPSSSYVVNTKTEKFTPTLQEIRNLRTNYHKVKFKKGNE